MSESTKTLRLSKIAKEFNISISTVIDFLNAKGHKIDNNPNAKLGDAEYALLMKEYSSDKSAKEEAQQKTQVTREKKETINIEDVKAANKKKKDDVEENIIIKDLTIPKNKVLEDLAKERREEIKKATEKQEEEAKKEAEDVIKAKAEKSPGLKVLSKIDLTSVEKKSEKKPAKSKETEKPKKAEVKEEVKPEVVKEIPETKSEETPVAEEQKEDFLATKFEKLEGPKILGKVELPVEKKPVGSSNPNNQADKKKRKRIKKGGVTQEEIKQLSKQGIGSDRSKPGQNRDKGRRRGPEAKPALTDEEIQAQIKETLARLSGGGAKSKASKYRREKREEIRERMEAHQEQVEADKKVLRVTEFVSANQLAQMMNLQVTQVISTCLQLGLFVSINQRLDAETISIVAEEFGYKVEFVTVEEQETLETEKEDEGNLVPRPPIVTVMGHVDHGKTSLLDYVRKSDVAAGEAGGITQHIGSYNVILPGGKSITFLDTPGHEAFTAMRARGAKVTDVAIIVVAADDSVMPQTKEAINHAQAAGVPMIFAINKIDKPGANPDKIREALANMNILVEEWGGKFQCQEVSAKQGKNMDLLLEKVLLESELLDLKANPNKLASGTVIEASLEEGRGYVANILVQNGTLRVGDVVLAGCHSGRVRAMFNERGAKVKEAGPAHPVKILGLSGAPQAGDKFNVMEDEREAREIANKRLQLQREQGMRAKKHITLDEIGRRLAIGDFKELNIIVKGDVDGSIEAIADSLLKLSTEKIQVNIIHKSVGAISESDVMLASASNAIIVGFQVRPTGSAKKLAEQEEIDIRMYSIIYDAINEVKAAMEGMLAPEYIEKIVANIEIREVFKITKVGTVAGCYVLDGKLTRNTKVRIIRDGIVIYSGALGSLKRFKEDVKEVTTGYECGLNIENFNDIKVGDIIEGYEMVEVKAKL